VRSVEEGDILEQRDGQVVSLILNRPRWANSLTWSMYRELLERCERVDRDESIRVLILRGAGGQAFCAGTDIRQFRDFETAEDGLRYEREVERVVGRVESIQTPTMAVVEGHATGAGLLLAVACDFRVCTLDARFGVPIARTVGNCLSIRNLARLVALIGSPLTRELLYTGRLLTATEARDAGLVTTILAADRVAGHVRDLCEHLIGRAPLTLRATKEGLRRLTADRLPEDEDLIRTCYGSEDFKEGVEAFAQDRVPNWRGH
jgi:enoyl-CoA hydratase/carnithine racemase